MGNPLLDNPWTTEQLEALGVDVEAAKKAYQALKDDLLSRLPADMEAKAREALAVNEEKVMKILDLYMTPQVIGALVLDCRRDFLAQLLAGKGKAKNRVLGLS
jgi:hypothetical protein